MKEREREKERELETEREAITTKNIHCWRPKMARSAVGLSKLAASDGGEQTADATRPGAQMRPHQHRAVPGATRAQSAPVTDRCHDSITPLQHTLRWATIHVTALYRLTSVCARTHAHTHTNI